jgi:hypothetical protein
LPNRFQVCLVVSIDYVLICSVVNENEPDVPFDASSLVETLTTGMAMKIGDMLDHPDLLEDDSQV